MAVTRDWIPKQIDKFKIFGDNICKNCQKNAEKWNLIVKEVNDLLVLQQKFNDFYSISSIMNNRTLIDIQNTRDARKPYQAAIRNLAIKRLKTNALMSDEDKRRCGININSKGYTLSVISKKSPLVHFENTGICTAKMAFSNPENHKCCMPEGQNKVIVTFGFYKENESIPKEIDCTFTVIFGKSFSKIVFDASKRGMHFVGYARYINTRKKVGRSATQFFGIVS